jgi:hypothetical protein
MHEMEACRPSCVREFNWTIAGRILMKFSTNIVPLETIQTGPFSILYNQKYHLGQDYEIM